MNEESSIAIQFCEMIKKSTYQVFCHMMLKLFYGLIEMKYKPCCGHKCMLANCEISEAGGCYCICRLVDYIEDIEDVLSGEMIYQNGAFIFHPKGKKKKPEKSIEIEMKEKLEKARARLKKFELI